MTAIYKRELKSYLTSMVGYLFIFFILVLTGIYFSAYQLNVQPSLDQRERFAQQDKNAENGDEEAQHTDEDFLNALAVGMPRSEEHTSLIAG